MDEEPDHPEDPSAAEADEDPGVVRERPRRSDRHRSRRARRRQERRRREETEEAAAAESAAEEPADPGRARRSDVRRRRRRRTIARTVLVVVALIAAAVVVLLSVSGLADRARELVGEPEQDLEELPGDVQPTLAIVTRGEEGTGDGARHISVLAHDRRTNDGTVLFVPPSTVADVPGHGSFGVGDAFAFGDTALVGVTLENLLGVRIDAVIDLSEAEWAAVLERFGAYEIDVPSRLRTPAEEGGALRFEAGPQTLDGQRLAEYLAFREAGESELDVLPRVQRVLQGLLDEISADPEEAGRLLLDAAGVLGSDEPELIRDVLVGLAEARAADRLAMLTLPVSPLAADQADAYRVDDERLERLVEDRLAASRPDDEAGAGRSLQILNGVGTPGIGQAVAERLQPGGYRVLLTGNADSFDYEQTRIVIYDDTPEQLAVARDVRDRLGVGEVERSGMPQSVVDVTIIVGADLLPELEGAGPPADEVGGDDARDADATDGDDTGDAEEPAP